MDFQKPDWAAGEVFDALLEYLCSDSIKSERTATYLTTAIFEGPPDSWINTCKKLKSLWGTCLWFAKQLPAVDRRQDRLVLLMCEIQKVPRPQGEGPDDYEEHKSGRIWTGMPEFIAALVDFEVDAPLVPRLKDRPPYIQWANHESGPWSKDLSPLEWTNVNAFIARIHTSSPHLTRLDTRGLFALLDALEEHHTAETLDNLVPAAACWIIHAGTAIKNNSIEYANFEEDGAKRLPSSVGDLYSGPKAFNDERRAFWKTRFRELMVDEDLKLETRSYARKAWEEM